MHDVRTAMVFLFDTCTSRCAYCRHAVTGKVMDQTQLMPFRDREHVDRFLGFFERRTTGTTKWLLMMLGGEPLLMPNFAHFMDRLRMAGNKAAIYTSLNIGPRNAALRYLLEAGSDVTDYVMASFHPEADAFEDAYFDMLLQLKDAGHSVIFRFVAHPLRLQMMQRLAERCREIDVCFSPYAYTSAAYPMQYTPEQRERIGRYTSNYSQVIQMENGLQTGNLSCRAVDGLMYVNARDGRIFPCPNVFSSVVGNVYEDRLDAGRQDGACHDPEAKCFCDVNFQQAGVLGVDDSANFTAEKRGYVEAKSYAALKKDLLDSGVQFHRATHSNSLGQGSRDDQLVLSKQEVRAAFAHAVCAADDHSGMSMK